MAYEVIDARGRVRRLRDREICPDGCSLRMPMQFKDGVRRAVARLSDAEVAAQAANEAWYAYRRRLGTPKARRSSLPPTPSWQAPPVRDGAPREYVITDEMMERCRDARAEYIDRLGAGMNRHRIPVTEESADAVVEAMDADPDFHPGRYARDRMIERVSNAWRYSRDEE